MPQMLPLPPTLPACIVSPLPPHAAAVRRPTPPTLLDNSNTNGWYFAAFRGPFPSSIPPSPGHPGGIYCAHPADLLRPDVLRAGAPHSADGHDVPSESGPTHVMPPRATGAADSLADIVMADRAAAGACADPAAAGERTIAVATRAAAAVDTTHLAIAPHRPRRLLLEALLVSARGDNHYNNVKIANIATATGAATAKANDDDHYYMTETAATGTAVAEAAAVSGISWVADDAGPAPDAAGVVAATAANSSLAIAGAATITAAAARGVVAAGQPTYEELLVRNRFIEAELARLRQGAVSNAKPVDRGQSAPPS
jgi:hypothetical protein